MAYNFYGRRKSKKDPKIHKYYTKEEYDNLPLGKKKMAFVAWLMRKGVSLSEARLICSRKFKNGDGYYE